MIPCEDEAKKKGRVRPNDEDRLREGRAGEQENAREKRRNERRIGGSNRKRFYSPRGYVHSLVKLVVTAPPFLDCIRCNDFTSF